MTLTKDIYTTLVHEMEAFMLKVKRKEIEVGDTDFSFSGATVNSRLVEGAEVMIDGEGRIQKVGLNSNGAKTYWSRRKGR